MLAMQPEEDVQRWLETHELRVFTSFTIARRERLAAEFASIRAQGLGLVGSNSST